MWLERRDNNCSQNFDGQISFVTNTWTTEQQDGTTLKERHMQIVVQQFDRTSLGQRLMLDFGIRGIETFISAKQGQLIARLITRLGGMQAKQ